MNSISSLYLQATKRLFLLDYDGTLTPLMPAPPQAAPSKQLLALLRRLSHDPKNTVVIVSGRDRQTLQAWLGHLPLYLAAEHGFAVREREGAWSEAVDVGPAWKKPVRALLAQAASSVTGSLIEEKNTALCWHYRQAEDMDSAVQAQRQLQQALQPLCKQLGLRTIYGHKVVEVQPLGANKGTAARDWFAREAWGFILVAGDDTTDEDMFAASPQQAITVKIGEPPTAARQTIPDVGHFIQLLHTLIGAQDKNLL